MATEKLKKKPVKSKGSGSEIKGSEGEGRGGEGESILAKTKIKRGSSSSGESRKKSGFSTKAKRPQVQASSAGQEGRNEWGWNVLISQAARHSRSFKWLLLSLGATAFLSLCLYSTSQLQTNSTSPANLHSPADAFRIEQFSRAAAAVSPSPVSENILEEDKEESPRSEISFQQAHAPTTEEPPAGSNLTSQRSDLAPQSGTPVEAQEATSLAQGPSPPPGGSAIPGIPEPGRRESPDLSLVNATEFCERQLSNESPTPGSTDSSIVSPCPSFTPCSIPEQAGPLMMCRLPDPSIMSAEETEASGPKSCSEEDRDPANFPPVVEGNWAGYHRLLSGPKAEEVENMDLLSRVPDPGCRWYAGERGGWVDHNPLTMFELTDVFVGPNEEIFNSSLRVDPGACPYPFSLQGLHKRYRRTWAKPQVYHKQLNVALRLFHQSCFNLYHAFVELIPTFYLLRPFFKSNPNIPIIYCTSGSDFESMYGMSMLGPSVKELNITSGPRFGHLLYVKKIYQPYQPRCLNSHPQVFFELRRRHYLRPDGLPFFNEGWMPRDLKPLSHEEMMRVPSNWVVVFFRRAGQTRRIVNASEIHRKLIGTFGPDRVTQFFGTESIDHAKQLFNRAVFLIGPHGAGLSFMVFMPSGSVVLELRPTDRNRCYRRLAIASNLKFRLIFGNGTKQTNLVMNMTRVDEEIDLVHSSLVRTGRISQ